MSEYPYEDKIHSKDRVNYKTVKSSDGKRIGKVEAAFAESFIVKSEKQNKNKICQKITILANEDNNYPHCDYQSFPHETN